MDPTSIIPRAEISRRDALKLLATGMAAIQAGCLEPPGEEIRPYVRRPETSPGTPRYYATSMVIDGFATGLLVEAHRGRPTKIEGNPAHPASLGATTAFHQAAIFELYDPHRLRAPRTGDLPATWERLRATLDPGRLPAGPLWLVMPPYSSPVVAALIDRIRERRPETRVVVDDPLDHDAAYRGSRLAFGAPLEQQLALDRADVVVALDADVLAGMPASLRWARDFAARRRPDDRMNQLFVAEPAMTPTGTLADHRLPIRAGDVSAVALALRDALARHGVALPRPAARARSLPAAATAWVDRVARALATARERSAIVVGDRQPAACHALAYQLTAALGAIGTTTTFVQPARLASEHRLADLAAGGARAIVILETNPVYSAPHALDLRRTLAAAPLTVHLTQHVDETSAACTWVAPASHFLESWGDARAYDGTLSPVQPLIRPLHATRSTLEVLAILAGDPRTDARELVRQHWQRIAPDVDWHTALSEGVVAGTAFPARTVDPVAGDPRAIVAELDTGRTVPDGAYEIALSTSPQVHDGRFATNPWLQELPHPITKLTWGNAAMLGSVTAAKLGVSDGDELRIEHAGGALTVPAIVTPGHADAAITIELGYGRVTPGGPLVNALGADATVLRGDSLIVRAAVRATGRHHELARTQTAFSQLDREIALHATLEQYREDPGFTRHHRGPQPSLIGVPERTGIQWAMTIDTSICTGCSACVIACQAENNSPVVGAESVRRGREMHWLRIDTYVDDDAHVIHQPMLCQHCETAPCEYVCPTFATTHSPDGLNEMTYNRCIGTRFCSNNCPYKVRRFNWFGFDEHPTSSSLQHNPDVTVRSRGVMEKCTYCVQRIRGAEIAARMEDRAIRPGEVVTACQQACPTRAIQFGALEHADTPMMQARREPRRYAALHELGARPRTLYLAKITNPGDA